MSAAGKDLPFLRLAAWPLLLTAGAQYGLFRFLQRINYFLPYVAPGGKKCEHLPHAVILYFQ